MIEEEAEKRAAQVVPNKRTTPHTLIDGRGGMNSLRKVFKSSLHHRQRRPVLIAMRMAIVSGRAAFSCSRSKRAFALPRPRSDSVLERSPAS